ncbi:MAG TPA: AMP-binding protein [Sphingobium sp.]|nr:AMP-binding protein [Sphingobium sp.]
MPQTMHVRETDPELAARYRRMGFWVDETLTELLDKGLRENPAQRYRIWSDDRPYDGTFGDVRDKALRLAASFVAMGVKPGDVISFQLPNWIEGVIAFMATLYTGAVSLPIVQIYGSKEMRFVLQETKARLHVTVDRFRHIDYRANIEAMLPDLPALERVIYIDQDFPDLLATEPLAEPVQVHPDTPVMLGYTSGTTSDPKGVIHTHRTTVAEMLQRAKVEPGDEKPLALAPPEGFDRWLVGSPLGHVSGLQIGVFVPILFNKPAHLIDKWDMDFVLDLLVKEDLHVGAAANYFFNSLITHPKFDGEKHIPHMRYILSGGAPVPRAFGEQCDAMGISLIRGYGSTEHPSVTGSAFADPFEQRIGTDGRALGGVEIQLRDLDGKPVPQGEQGEIWTRGPDLFVGYVDTRLNEAAFDAEGWFCMGDVGVMNAEGFLTITDRTKDIIIRGGENISALEVEDAVCRMPGIVEVAAVAAPDARMGEHVCVFLRLAEGTPAPGLKELRDHLANVGLARQKWPEEIRIVDEFERTSAGKVKKFVLRDMLRAEAGKIEA